MFHFCPALILPSHIYDTNADIVANYVHIPKFLYLREIYTQFPSWRNRISIKQCVLFRLEIDDPIVYEQDLYLIYVYHK
jgi:hypothetical protein